MQVLMAFIAMFSTVFTAIDIFTQNEFSNLSQKFVTHVDTINYQLDFM